MNQLLIQQIILVLICFIFSSCIRQSAPKADFAASQTALSLLPPVLYLTAAQNACVLTSSAKGASVCFHLKPENCNLDFFNNITDATKLQNRKDDLTFISINYSSCSAGVSALFTKYNAMTPPASMLLQSVAGMNGANTGADFIFYTGTSCADLGLEKSPFVPVTFSRLTNDTELASLNSVTADLALIPQTTSQCITDLNFKPEFMPLISGIRDGSLVNGIACSLTTSGTWSKCPWIK